MIAAIPLAWLQLTREKIRLLVALAGIGFAVILMFMQLGFRDALFESAVTLHTQIKADILLISPQSTTLVAMKSFAQRRLYQARGFDGVEAVSPLYLDLAIWKNPLNRQTRSILVIGIDPSDDVFEIPAVNQNLAALKMPDVVLFDQASRPEFGPIPAMFEQGQEISTEISGRRIKVGGLFKLGASFGADGNLITSDLNFLRLFAPRRTASLIDVGLIQLKPGVVPELVQANLKQALPNDVKVLTKQEFIDFEKQYWQTSTSIGFIFTIGTVMGFVVGTVIVYQILYTDVSDHLAEYATLRAMGYKSSYLFSVVFQEALILAVLGYLPGFVLCLGLYTLTRNATSLPMLMTMDRGILVLILAIVMCSLSGAIAVRKVQSADPADIF